MPHSYNKIWIHAIFGTKYRTHFLNAGIEKEVHQIIKDKLRELGCPVRIINGMPDHVHCLFLLNPQKSIMEVMKIVKGSSSYYINQNKLIDEKFTWQIGYGAFSVSQSVMVRAFNYIKNQKEHHRKKDFKDEYAEFLELHRVLEDTFNTTIS